MAMMVPGDEVYDCLISLIIGTIVMFILAGYFFFFFFKNYKIKTTKCLIGI